MCLCSTTGKKIAVCDIVCYKALFNFAGEYYTPVKWKKVKNAVLTGRRLFRGGLFRQKHTNEGVTVIEGGYIHVFRNQWCRFLYKTCACFKCVIPKGTEYWVNFDTGELAARKIRFVEQVK